MSFCQRSFHAFGLNKAFGSSAAAAEEDHFSHLPPTSTATLNIQWTGSATQLIVSVSSVNLCLCSGAFHIGRKREDTDKIETTNVESCSASFKNEKKWCYNWLVWLAVIYMLCGSVIPHTPLISFSLPLSICSAFLCANVYARFMAPKDKERHLLLCDVASRPHD